MVLLAGALALLVVLIAIGAVIAVVKAFGRDAIAFQAVAVIGLVVLGITVVWLPLMTWRAGNWLARVGMSSACPACGGLVPAREPVCGCGQQLRVGASPRPRLTELPAGGWPVLYAPVAYVMSLLAVLAVHGLVLLSHAHVTALAAVALVDLSMLAVALRLAGRAEPLEAWKFGLRRAPLVPSVKALFVAHLGVGIATGLYVVAFGPFTTQHVTLLAPAEPAGLIVALVLLAPVAEEFFFRGFIYATLRRGLGVTAAALATTAMFVLAHWLSSYPLWALAPIAFLSLASCLLYERTGSIWPSVALHMANNASVLTSPVVAGVTLCVIAVVTVAVLQRTGARAVGQPHWAIPALAGGLCAVILLVVSALEPPSPAQRALSWYVHPAGFTSAGQPRTGTYVATGTILTSIGYANLPSGAMEQRAWRITATCYAGYQCAYFLTRQTLVGPLTTQLLLRSDGWHAYFPPEELVCGEERGYPLAWQQQSTVILEFGPGAVIHANEAIYSSAPWCGTAGATRRWVAVAQGT